VVPVAASWCSVRITVNGAEIEPADGLNYAFDSGSGGDSWRDTPSFVSPGRFRRAHMSSVRYATFGGGSLSLDDWAMVIERVRLS
jgi:hypothetical protein